MINDESVYEKTSGHPICIMYIVNEQRCSCKYGYVTFSVLLAR